MNLILGVWNINHRQCGNKLTIYRYVYQIHKCEHIGAFITSVVLSQIMMTFDDLFIIIFNKNKDWDWGYHVLSFLNINLKVTQEKK